MEQEVKNRQKQEDKKETMSLIKNSTDDTSLCVGIDATTLSTALDTEVLVNPAGSDSDRFRSELDRYWKLDRSTNSPTKELMSEKIQLEVGPSPEVVKEVKAEVEDDKDDWVMCPDKDSVPDADYAPHLRKRRPKKTGSAGQPSQYCNTSPDNINETNEEPPPVAFADVLFVIGLGILRLSLEILANCN